MIPRNGLPIKNQPQKKSRPSLLGRLFLWLAILASIFVGFGLLARIPSFQIQVGEYQNIIVTDTQAVTDSLNQYLQERFLYPRSNRLWFSERKAGEYVEENFPRISQVKISSSSGFFSVYGEEREGAYLWCGKEIVPVTVDSVCYFADKTGFIFDIAPYFSGTSYLRLYGGTISEKIIGSQAFTQEIFDAYEIFKNTLSDFDLHIQGIYIVDTDQIEFLLFSNNEMPEAPKLKHYLPNKEDVVADNISSALRQDSVFLDITNNYDRLEYLDARFKNQLVYKFFGFVNKEEITNEESIEQHHTDIQEEAQSDTSTQG